eukprot:TRINITY_DN1286_c1_g2_i1.p1 TRINITY_DN1286_c1_g2~~TRINITY_DN1286_c1_g2_i1.p1  ORF type:complete len:280 (+),score=77.31 TRINITY_DN1286_c1_g2_i1:61-840(+)
MSRAQRKVMAEQTMNALKEGSFKGHSFGDTLAKAIKASRVHLADDDVKVKGEMYKGKSELLVVEGTTLMACEKYKDEKLGVLNFASARNPGGGFLGGSQAQEESLARSSGLFPCLDKFMKEMYIPHRNAPSGAYTHTMIVSPDVPIFRRDDGTEVPPYTATFVSSPAPNNGVLEKKSVSNAPALVSDALEERIRRVLTHMHNEHRETIVLGAFGCGVFGNHPETVAAIFKKQLQKFNFPRVVFAITDRKMVAVFKSVLA